jgi:hypothetical protein
MTGEVVLGAIAVASLVLVAWVDWRILEWCEALTLTRDVREAETAWKGGSA